MLVFRRVIRVIVAVVVIGLIHYAFMRDQPEVGFYGIVILALLGILSGPWPVRMVFFAVGLVALLGAAGYGGANSGRYMLLAVPVAIHLGGMLIFGLTLLPGRVPLITRFSRFDNQQATGPEIDRHTRIVTALWAGYFASIAVVAVILAIAGNFQAASWILTIVSPGSSAALFLLEHLYRYLRKDLFGHASVFRTLRIVAHPDAWRGLMHDV